MRSRHVTSEALDRSPDERTKRLGIQAVSSSSKVENRMSSCQEGETDDCVLIDSPQLLRPSSSASLTRPSQSKARQRGEGRGLERSQKVLA